MNRKATPETKTALFAGGCFWCTEAVFQRIKGVVKVEAGYAGGVMTKPSYEHVSSGITGHAESIKISYDPKKISYDDLVYIFFKMHDPTQINRQGADVGTQYRSCIFYYDDEQKESAQKALKDAQKNLKNKIVTQILPYKNFFKAEKYHQNYYNSHSGKIYCKLVIDPKIEKLRQNYSSYLNNKANA